MYAKTNFRKLKPIQILGVLVSLSISLFISVTLISCEGDPLGSVNNSGGNDNSHSPKNSIDEEAASRCDYVYSWRDIHCWEDVSTPEQFHQAIVCSHEALNKYYKCLKKYAHYPAGFCDCYSSCHQLAAQCIGGCAPGNPALEEQTCLDGCMNMIGDCLVDCGLAHPYPGTQ